MRLSIACTTAPVAMLLLASGVAAGRNHLAGETSPYLLQHAANPVWWWPWSPEALAEARRQQKPIFLSIGYATCHWCHVMERESFSRPDVADVLNASFVAIKVDREERPDLDAIYLSAVRELTGNAGWPATLLLTPEGRPFVAATYLSHDALVELLQRADREWRRDRSRSEARGARLAEGLARELRPTLAARPDEGALRAFLGAFKAGFDDRNGGYRGAPKFPPSYALRLLLRLHRRSGDARALEMATRTLDAIARGGICDQLGGGFHRYATDERWRVPHFEKMLYDQAALAQAYVEAFAATAKPAYARVTRQTLDYALAVMTAPGGGFFAGEDADSEGEEGRFYVWSAQELRSVLSPSELEAFRRAYTLFPPGDAAAGVLQRVADPGGDDDTLRHALAVLRRARDGRSRPRRDESVLADWNGLMIAALAKAGRVLAEPRYVAAAANAARFLLARLPRPDGSLAHSLSGGEARGEGNLDDYAFLVDGLIELYQADFDRRWLDQAVALQDRVESRFSTEQGSYAFSDGADSSLLVREVRSRDDVVPAGNSVVALNLLRLADLLQDEGRARRANGLLAATPRDVREDPGAYPALLMALDYASDRHKQVAIAGDPASAATRALVAAVERGRFNPNLVVAAGLPGPEAVPLLRDKKLLNGLPTAYVCELRLCRQPTSDPTAAARLAGTFEPLR